MADNFRENYADEAQRALDSYAHAHTTIDTLHRMVHDGFVFHTSGKVTGMVNGNVDEFLITIPASTYPHFQRLRLFAGRGSVDMVVYEGATTSASGTALPVRNTNRNSTNVAGTTVHSGPTITDVGTLVHTSWLVPTGAGVGQTANGIVGETNGEEWVLKPDTKYIIRITNNSGATISYAYDMLWYEIGYDQ